jgi:microcystin-dependent protein
VASPPFDINAALPGDNDIVSQHPTNARAMRDIVESWLLINHNVQGRHDEVEVDHKADAGYAGTASVTTVWASSETNEGGHLKQRRGTGAIDYVSQWWPGDMKPSARGADHEGWLLCDGRNVSRTTYARLFNAIGGTFGVGDGATTFGLPDGKGRTLAGVDAGSTRLDSFTVVGAAIGLKNHTLALSETPAHDHGGAIVSTSAGDHKHGLSGANILDGAGARPLNTSSAIGGNNNPFFGYVTTQGANDVMTTVGAHTHTTTIPSAGGGGAHNNVQPTLAINWFIKT